MPASRSVPMNHAFEAESRIGLAARERVDDPVPREAADDEKQAADDDERDADGTQRLPPPALGEVDGDGEQHEDGDRQPDGELADELDGGLRRPELIRLHDHDAAGVGAETLLDLGLGQADAVGQLLDERLEVEHDVPLARSAGTSPSSSTMRMNASCALRFASSQSVCTPGG